MCEIFIERLKSVRESSNLTNNQIEEMYGIKTRTLQFYLSGSREPKLEALVSLSKAFDVSIDYLCGLTDNPKINF